MSVGKVTECFSKELEARADQTNAAMAQLLRDQQGVPQRLAQAMKYVLEGPGKRLRAAMTLWCCEIAGGKVNDDAVTCAAAIEMVHCYSLVHDDLPAMDDDDLRRGRPTCHVAFDEATAILTGDALLTLAFELLAKRLRDPKMAARLIAELAEAAGPAGMIGGQMADMEGQGAQGSVEMLEYIHANKTAKMFRAACRMGAICGGAKDEIVEALGRYGLKTGLGFQIRDDILDVSQSSHDIGKTAGKDARQGKMTYPAVVGLAESEAILNNITRQAVDELNGFGSEADILRTLAAVLTQRKK